MKIKILVSYHKPAKLIRDDVWTPIKIGSCPNWDPENLIEDSDGENISNLNDSYNELTAIYWAWKNFDKLGNPDFIGFCHYRRIPIFLQDLKRAGNSFTVDVLFDNIDSLFDSIKYSRQGLEKLLSNYQCLSGSFFDKKYSVREQYKKASSKGEHVYEDLLDAENIVKEHFPEYGTAADKYLSGNKQYCGNIFVLRKDLFFRYCEFIFGVIEIFLSRHDFSQRPAWLRRLFISERLTGIFITRLKEKGYNVLDLPVGFIVNTELALPIKKIYKSKSSINLAFSVDVGNLSRLGVCLSSLIENVRLDRCYDVIVLHSPLLKREKIEEFLIKINLACPKNVSVRFCDVSPWLKKRERGNRFDKINFRFLVQNIFSNYEKILYLHSDLIVLGDLSNIYDLPGEDAVYVGAALGVQENLAYQQNSTLRGRVWRDYVDKTLNIENAYTYFKMEVMLFYLEEMRKRDFKLIEACENELKNIDDPVYLEQDILNVVFKKHVKYIPLNWCLDWAVPLLYPSYKRILDEDLLKLYAEGMRCPVIISYASDKKPWEGIDLPLGSVWWRVARSSLFYRDFLKNRFYDLSIADAKTAAGVVFRKLLIYWKYRLFMIIGFKREHYRSKLGG